jgi:hypothetical protein
VSGQRWKLESQITCEPLKKAVLTTEGLCEEASYFAEVESTHSEALLYGITDGKALGTYLEHKF